MQTSTSEVYGTALTMPINESHPLQGQSPYSASKIAADMMAEAFARSFGVPVVILRPFNTFGPRQSERAIIGTIIRQALDPSCPAILVGDATTVRDLTFVTDTAAAFMAAGLAEGVEYGHAYNAGSQRAIMVGDLIDLIIDLTASRKPVVQDDKRLRPPNSEVRALLAEFNPFRACDWMVSAGRVAGRVGNDGRVVASSPFRQAGPQAEGLHHVIAVLALSRCVPAASLANAIILTPTTDLSHHLA